MSLKIIGNGIGIPKKSLSNDDLAGLLDTTDEWIFSRTGIKTRHICTDENLTDLATDAAMQAIESAGLSIDDIDLIICATTGGDYRTPSLACNVAERIDASCPAFDINAACSGFVYSLEVASGLIANGKYKNILIVCAELLSSMVDWNHRSISVLFGDAAGACIVTSGNALRYINISNISGTSVLNMPNSTGNSPYFSIAKDIGFVHMNGREVFRFAVNAVNAELNRALNALGIEAEQIDWFLLHQANKRIVDAARTKVRQPEEKFPVNIDRYGNTSSASIPLLMFEMLQDKRIKPGDTLFLSSFGAGLTSGSCVIVWE